jgi:hypothetical protein
MAIDVRDWHREGLLRAGNCFPHFLIWMGEPTEVTMSTLIVAVTVAAALVTRIAVLIALRPTRAAAWPNSGCSARAT